MCVNDSVDKITRKWVEFVPSILCLGGIEFEVLDVKTQKDYFEAIKKIIYIYIYIYIYICIYI